MLLATRTAHGALLTETTERLVVSFSRMPAGTAVDLRCDKTLPVHALRPAGLPAITSGRARELASSVR
jgi:hypothetical protein